jgi:hypothetical protein
MVYFQCHIYTYYILLYGAFLLGKSGDSVGVDRGAWRAADRFDDDQCIARLRYCHLVTRLNLDAAVLVPSLLSSPFKANAKGGGP